jgi:hypothetical protein
MIVLADDRTGDASEQHAIGDLGAKDLSLSRGAESGGAQEGKE